MMLRRIVLMLVFLSFLFMNNSAAAEEKEIKVGIYKGKRVYGSAGVYDTLKEIPHFNPQCFTKIDKENLLKYDVVIVPCVARRVIKEKERIALSAYAYSGYGVLISSYSVGGWRGRVKVFPEIAATTGRINDHIMLTTDKNHPVTRGLHKIIHSYYDHIILKPGSLGKVLADDRSGVHPEVIAGVVGNKGKVLCTGNIFGYGSGDNEKKVEGNERKLLIQGIEWLAKDTPKDSSSYSGWEKISKLRLKIEKRGLESHNKISDLYYNSGSQLDGAEYDLSIFKVKQPKINSKIESLQKELKKLILNLRKENDRFTQRILQKTFRLMSSEEIQSIQQQIKDYEERISKKVKKIEQRFSPEIEPLVEEVNQLTKERIKPIPREKGWFTKNRFIRVITNSTTFKNPGYTTQALNWLNITASHIYYFQDVVQRGKSIDIEKELYELSKKYNLPIIPGTIGIAAQTRGKNNWLNPEELKEAIKKEYDTWGKYPGFAGLELDEPTIRDKHVRNEEGYKRFREYLKNKYSSSRLKELNISNLENVIPPDKWEESPVLWTEWQYFKIETMANYLKEIEDYLKSLREDLVLIPIIQQLLACFPQYASYPAMGAKLDCTARDPYNNANLEEAFLLDLAKSNAKGKTLHVIAPCYCEGPYTYARNLIQSLTHADGVWLWNFDYQSKYQPPSLYATWTWKEGMWKETIKAFSKMEKTEKYLVNTQPVSEIALIFSERTGIIDSYNKNFNIRQYFSNVMGWYQALMESHIQCVPEFTESLNKEKLKRYKVILLPDARCLSEKEIKLLKNWVKEGGVLIATGSSTLYDEWGRKRKDYALGELFGVKYKGSAKGKDKFTYQGLDIAYDKERLFDTIQPLKAKVIGKWDNGEPAVTENFYGKGKVIFISANKLGLCYEGASDKGYGRDLYKDYLPGVRSFIANIVSKSLKEQGSSLPFKVSNCPEMVEVIMKKQPGRYIIHFTNYGYKHPVRNIRIEIPVPSSEKIKAFYPEDKQRIRIRKGGDKIWFKIREFDIHEMVVIEY